MNRFARLSLAPRRLSVGLAVCALGAGSFPRDAASAPAPAAAESPRGLAAIRVPDGFVVSVAAASDLAPYPMCAAFDPAGALYVADSSGKDLSGEEMVAAPECRIRRLSDDDGDGVFDRSTLFADGLSLPMGACFHGGALYVASPPDFLRFSDADGDGVAERREVLLTGWNVKNTASLHGPFFAPDGRMVLTHGRHGYSIATREGATLDGLAARIWLCEPDGSGLERFCGGGFDNPVEVVHLPGGDMVGTMTYFTDPRDGQRDALMHWVEGGVYPKRHAEALAEFPRTGELLPPMTRFARIAPAGLLRWRSAAFGEEYVGNLFSAQFNPHRVQRHVLARDGSTWRCDDSDFLASEDPDFHPTDALEDADGSMIVLDTGGWYVDACPLSRVSKPDVRGTIYRVRRADAPAIADARGEAIDWKAATPKSLAARLADARPWVRDRAVEELVARGNGAVAALAGARRGAKSAEARCAAVWALARVARADPDAGAARAAIREALWDESVEVRVAAVGAIRRAGDARAIEAVARIAESDEPAVRRVAADALAALAAPASGSGKRDGGAPGAERFARRLLASATPGADPFLSHAQVRALTLLGADRPLLATLRPRPADAESPSPSAATRRLAFLALEGMRHPKLSGKHARSLLESDDAELRSVALSVAARHSDWAADAIDYARGRILDAEFGAESPEAATLREALVAYAGDAGAREVVARALAGEGNAAARAIATDLAAAMAVDPFPDDWTEAVGAILADANADEGDRVRALRLVRTRAIAALLPRAEAIAADGAASEPLRLAAMEALGAEAANDPARFDWLLSRLAPEAAASTRLAAAKILARADYAPGGAGERLARLAGEGLAAGDAATRAALLEPIARAKDPAAATAALATLAALDAGAAPADASAETRVRELAEVAGDAGAEAARKLLAAAETARAGRSERLRELEPLLSGGDVGRGRAVFFGAKASCGSCHAIGGEGGRLAPDLTSIGAIRTGRDLLEAIVFPSSTIVPDYRTFRVETGDDVLNGLIVEETSDAVALATGPDAVVRVPRDSIADLSPSDVSIMPEGLDLGLPPEEMRDLLAFLQAQNGEQWLQPARREAKR